MSTKKNKSKQGTGIAIGMAIGTAIGIALDNLALWIPLGLVFGVGIGKRMDLKNNDKDDN